MKERTPGGEGGRLTTPVAIPSRMQGSRRGARASGDRVTCLSLRVQATGWKKEASGCRHVHATRAHNIMINVSNHPVARGIITASFKIIVKPVLNHPSRMSI
jgi:hypothetical protein